MTLGNFVTQGQFLPKLKLGGKLTSSSFELHGYHNYGKMLLTLTDSPCAAFSCVFVN